MYTLNLVVPVLLSRYIDTYRMYHMDKVDFKDLQWPYFWCQPFFPSDV